MNKIPLQINQHQTTRDQQEAQLGHELHAAEGKIWRQNTGRLLVYFSTGGVVSSKTNKTVVPK